MIWPHNSTRPEARAKFEYVLAISVFCFSILGMTCNPCRCGEMFALLWSSKVDFLSQGSNSVDQIQLNKFNCSNSADQIQSFRYSQLDKL